MIGRREAIMRSREFSAESGVLLSVAVGDVARNLRNVVFDIASGSNAPRRRRLMSANRGIVVDASVVSKCILSSDNVGMFRVLKDHLEIYTLFHDLIFENIICHARIYEISPQAINDARELDCADAPLR